MNENERCRLLQNIYMTLFVYDWLTILSFDPINGKWQRINFTLYLAQLP